MRDWIPLIVVLFVSAHSTADEAPGANPYRPTPYVKIKHPEWTKLWNAAWGATMISVPNSAPAKVLSFVRQNAADKVFAVLNLSGEPQAVTFKESLYHGKYTSYFGGEGVELDAAARLELLPWGYKIFTK